MFFLSPLNRNSNAACTPVRSASLCPSHSVFWRDFLIKIRSIPHSPFLGVFSQDLADCFLLASITLPPYTCIPCGLVFSGFQVQAYSSNSGVRLLLSLNLEIFVPKNVNIVMFLSHPTLPSFLNINASLLLPVRLLSAKFHFFAVLFVLRIYPTSNVQSKYCVLKLFVFLFLCGYATNFV